MPSAIGLATLPEVSDRPPGGGNRGRRTTYPGRTKEHRSRPQALPKPVMMLAPGACPWPWSRPARSCPRSRSSRRA